MRRSNAYYYKKARQYALDVASGQILACKWLQMAALRFLDDRAASKSPNYPYYIDAAAAGKACRFIERMPLTKGDGAAKKKKLILEPWQCFIVVNIFGWLKREDGYRRFTEAYVKVPRKSGKSELSAAIGLYMLAADGEVGAEVFCGGRVENQARKVFHAAAEMVRKEENLGKFLGLEVWGPRRKPDAITAIAKNAKFEPLIGKPDDGDNPHCYICDEYHEHQTDEQFDTMKTGMGSRMQGLILIITTAGGSIGGPCHTYEDNAKKVLQGVITNAEHQFIAVWEADADDDWRSDEALIKANPNLNVSVFLSKLKKDRADAINRNKSATFKAKHLNLWVGAEEAYFSIEAWLAARTHPDGLVTLAELKGRRCWLALDLAQKTDFCALAIWSPRDGGGFDVWTRFWLPEVTVDSTADGHNYRRWAYEGDFPEPKEGEPPDFDNCPAITVTDGAMVDFDHVEQDVWEIWKLVDGVDLAFDPAHAAGLIPRLMKRGIECIEFANTAKNMSDPMMLLDGYIRDGLIRHSGNPVMDWMISNTVRRKSKRLDLDYPDRSMPDNKIDGVVAALMAGGRQVYADEAPQDFILRVR